jgi:hypothetical protein
MISTLKKDWPVLLMAAYILFVGVAAGYQWCESKHHAYECHDGSTRCAQ